MTIQGEVYCLDTIERDGTKTHFSSSPSVVKHSAVLVSALPWIQQQAGLSTEVTNYILSSFISISSCRISVQNMSVDLDAWEQIIIWNDEDDYRKLQYQQKSTRESKHPPRVIWRGWNSLAKRGTKIKKSCVQVMLRNTSIMWSLFHSIMLYISKQNHQIRSYISRNVPC